MENEKLSDGQELKPVPSKDSRLYLFTEKALEEIESALKWAKVIASGASLPDIYYEKSETEGIAEERWPIDYDTCKEGLILAVISAGKEIGLSPFASLNMIVPIYGKMAIKGDGAKALIFSSGTVKEWKETAEGDIDKDDFKYTITSTRTNGTTITQAFGVHDAKRANLWVTQQKLNSNQGAMHRQSPWYRYPARMCMYRALGFISRDLYPDVLGQLVIWEEVTDYPDSTIYIAETKGGNVALNNIDGKTQKSEELTGAASDKVKKRQEKLGLGGDKKQLQKTAQELNEIEEGKKETLPGYTDDQLLKMGTKIYELAAKLKITEQIDSLPGKKSNKKYRIAMLAYQKGQFDEYLSLQKSSEIPAGTPGPGKSIEKDESIEEKPSTSHSTLGDEKDTDKNEKDQISDEIPASVRNSNPFGIKVAEIEEGMTEREFHEMRNIRLELADNGINDAVYEELATRIYFTKHNKVTYQKKFKDLETFLKYAKAVDIHYLLNRYDS